MAENLSPQYRRLNNARKEQTRRTPGTEYLSKIYEARGASYPFTIQPKASEDILALSELETYLCHSVITKVGQYAKRENFECTGLKVPEDPDQQGFVSTGSPCAHCVALGDPRPIGAMLVGTFRKEEPRTGRDGKPIAAFPAQARLLIATQDETQTQLIALARSKPCGGRLALVRISVTRGSDKNSCKVGTSFVPNGDYRGENMTKIPHGNVLKAAINKINMKAVFGPLTLDEQRASLMRHKTLIDANPHLKLVYDERAFARAISGDSSAHGDDPFGAASDNSGNSWGETDAWAGVADIESGETDTADVVTKTAAEPDGQPAEVDSDEDGDAAFDLSDWEDAV